MEQKNNDITLGLLETSHRRGASHTRPETAALRAAVSSRRWRRRANGLLNLAGAAVVALSALVAMAWVPGPGYGTFVSNDDTLSARAHCQSVHQMLSQQ